MAISYSISNGYEGNAADNSSEVTQGTSAPGTGDIEVRVSTAENVLETILGLQKIIRFMQDQVVSATGVVPV